MVLFLSSRRWSTVCIRIRRQTCPRRWSRVKAQFAPSSSFAPSCVQPPVRPGAGRWQCLVSVLHVLLPTMRLAPFFDKAAASSPPHTTHGRFPQTQGWCPMHKNLHGPLQLLRWVSSHIELSWQTHRPQISRDPLQERRSGSWADTLRTKLKQAFKRIPLPRVNTWAQTSNDLFDIKS